MTPAELYHLYRFDEPTRTTIDWIAIGLFRFKPTPESIPVIEQTNPDTTLKNINLAHRPNR